MLKGMTPEQRIEFGLRGQVRRLQAEAASLWPEIASLRGEVERLRALNESLAERVAAQSELLSRRAERAKP